MMSKRQLVAAAQRGALHRRKVNGNRLWEPHRCLAWAFHTVERIQFEFSNFYYFFTPRHPLIIDEGEAADSLLTFAMNAEKQFKNLRGKKKSTS
jgi:hypothetical protein